MRHLEPAGGMQTDNSRMQKIKLCSKQDILCTVGQLLLYSLYSIGLGPTQYLVPGTTWAQALWCVEHPEVCYCETFMVDLLHCMLTDLLNVLNVESRLDSTLSRG